MCVSMLMSPYTAYTEWSHLHACPFTGLVPRPSHIEGLGTRLVPSHSMVFHMFLFRAVGSGAAGAAWATPRVKAREVWSLILYVHANVHGSKIGPNFFMLCVATLSTAAGSLFNQWPLHPLCASDGPAFQQGVELQQCHTSMYMYCHALDKYL